MEAGYQSTNTQSALARGQTLIDFFFQTFDKMRNKMEKKQHRTICVFVLVKRVHLFAKISIFQFWIWMMVAIVWCDEWQFDFWAKEKSANSDDETETSAV